jgi:endonuclease/exonuclease/phosphatase family metal-dependent hydrolase
MKNNTWAFALFLIILINTSTLLAQIDTLRITTYNLLNFPGTSWETRKPYFVTVLDSIAPDILAVQEVNDQEGVDSLLVAVLNNYELPGKFSSAQFIDIGALNNAFFYRNDIFNCINVRAIQTAERDINEYELEYIKVANAPHIFVYLCHLAAGSATDDKADRAAQTTILRNELNQHPIGTNFFVVGDFNFYTHSEDGFKDLTESQEDNDGRCFDPVNRPGSWHDNENFADVHTQCPRKDRFGGGAWGGIDDRFDFVFCSESIITGDSYNYLEGSYTAFGNDGQHFNEGVNVGTNLAVSPWVAEALYQAADHLPVIMDFIVTNTVPVELVSFKVAPTHDGLKLTWSTATETNNLGFAIEKALEGKNGWEEIAFIKGHDTTVEKNNYLFIDKKISPGQKYQYRLRQVDFSGFVEYSHTLSVTVDQYPNLFTLGQNYPNPFNPSTTIKYSILKNTDLTLNIYNVYGQLIRNLVSGPRLKGVYQIEWDGFDNNGLKVSSGLYIYELRNDDSVSSKKMTFIN